MRADRQQSYLGIYSLWPDIVSMVVLFDPEDDKIYCRALVWNAALLDLDGEAVTVMDRIY